MKKITTIVYTSFATLIPLLVFIFGYNYSLAAASNFKELIEETIISSILTPLVALLVSGAVVIFLWGVFKFIKAEGEEKEKGKNFMIWGIVGIFVMVSVWGLVNLLAGSFSLDNSTNIPVI